MSLGFTLVRLLLDPASACGGFACDGGPTPPVLQSAERIVFGVDEEANQVEMHVQITFEGQAPDFAWIVPVPEVPELFVTTSQLFTQVALATFPTFTLRISDDGRCREDNESTTKDTVGSYDAVASSGDDDDYSGFDVDVVGTQAVGPYETVTLRGDSSEDLLGWLNAQGYILPDTFEDVLAPYVSDGSYFVALKLAPDRTTGDLAPLGLRYPGVRATVPVQLTSISATPDMRMEVYLFGAGRGVPESYLHVRVNDAAIDWWTAGSNYPEVITAAANEAGGHAFATDYFGPTAKIGAFLTREPAQDVLRQIDDPYMWVTVLRNELVTAPPEVFLVIADQLHVDAATAAQIWQCPGCTSTYSVPDGFDPVLATDDLEARVLAPLRAAQRLLDDHPRLTRMTSSLDAVEMTVDPVFVMNHDLDDQPVDNLHTALEYYACAGRPSADAPRTLFLESGLAIGLPSENELADRGTNEFGYLSALRSPNAAVIEQFAATGQPETMVDHRPALSALVAEMNTLLGAPGCGGCASTTGGVGGLAALSIGLAAAASRRRHRR